VGVTNFQGGQNGYSILCCVATGGGTHSGAALALTGQAQPASVDPLPPALSTDARTFVASASETIKTVSSKGLISGKGVVLKMDRANATVKINHDPIPALDWPQMTMPFRLKESALADQVKEGNKVEFYLEKSDSDYVIVKWQK
jgi:Cu(I)/Ag(I) efflux system protein CusF